MSPFSLVIVRILIALAGSAGAGERALVTPQAIAECTPQFALLETGSWSAASELPFWRKDDAGAWGGEGWLGWTHEGDALLPVSLTVQDLPEEDGEVREVTVYSVPDVPFAARCIKGLEAGNIRVADVHRHDLLSGGPTGVALGQRRYHVAVRSSRDDLADARVILTDGQRTQVLYSTDGFADEPHFEIEWAGDLDGDGELDLVVNLSRKYSEHPHRLLLSSLASTGELVGEAARLVTGC